MREVRIIAKNFNSPRTTVETTAEASANAILEATNVLLEGFHEVIITDETTGEILTNNYISEELQPLSLTPDYAFGIALQVLGNE